MTRPGWSPAVLHCVLHVMNGSGGRSCLHWCCNGSAVMQHRQAAGLAVLHLAGPYRCLVCSCSVLCVQRL